MKHWLRSGAAGWRLDVADELPDEVIDRMRANLKSENPDALLLGEVWENATDKVSYGVRRRYALGGGLDSVMNYPLRAAILDFALEKTDAAGLRDFLIEQRLAYPLPMYRCLMNHLGTHDTPRLRTVLGSGSDGSALSRAQQAESVLTPAQNDRGRTLQKLCAALQFALPGMPCIYYGDEEGLQGFRDPFCRGTYHRSAGELRGYYAKLAAARNADEALSRGDAAFAAYGGGVLCILRFTPENAALVAVNRGSTPAEICPAIGDFKPLRASDRARWSALPSRVEIPACGSVYLKL